MRDLELLAEYLRQEIARRHASALKRLREGEYAEAQLDAKIADAIGVVLEDVKVLEKDSGEFIKRFLSN